MNVVKKNLRTRSVLKRVFFYTYWQTWSEPSSFYLQILRWFLNLLFAIDQSWWFSSVELVQWANCNVLETCFLNLKRLESLFSVFYSVFCSLWYSSKMLHRYSLFPCFIVWVKDSVYIYDRSKLNFMRR